MAGTRPKKLQKSTTDKVLFGVAGGLAEYLEIDAVLVRVVFVVLCFAGGLGLIAYIALALFMPEAPESEEESSPEGSSGAASSAGSPSQPSPSAQRNRTIVGAILIDVGAVFLLQQIDFFGWLRWDVLWPVIIIAVGVALVWGRLRR